MELKSEKYKGWNIAFVKYGNAVEAYGYEPGTERANLFSVESTKEMAFEKMKNMINHKPFLDAKPHHLQKPMQARITGAPKKGDYWGGEGKKPALGSDAARLIGNDEFAWRQYEELRKRGMSSEKALELYVNSVDGDSSQLPRHLATYAKKKGWFDKYD